MQAAVYTLIAAMLFSAAGRRAGGAGAASEDCAANAVAISGGEDNVHEQISVAFDIAH